MEIKIQNCQHDWKVIYNTIGGKTHPTNPTNGSKCKKCGKWKESEKSEEQLRWQGLSDWLNRNGDYR